MRMPHCTVILEILPFWLHGRRPLITKGDQLTLAFSPRSLLIPFARSSGKHNAKGHPFRSC